LDPILDFHDKGYHPSSGVFGINSETVRAQPASNPVEDTARADVSTSLPRASLKKKMGSLDFKSDLKPN
jgi:hypothetical protein